MTAITVPNILELQKSLGQKSWQGNRRATDKPSFFIFIPFIILISGLFILIKFTDVEKETRRNGTYINTTSLAFTDTFSFINSAIYSLNDTYLSSNLYYYVSSESLLSLYFQILVILPSILLGRLMSTLFTIMCKVSGRNWEYHSIMNGGRTMVTLTFLLAIKFQWSSATKPFLDHLIIALSITESTILLLSMISFMVRSIQTRNLNSIFRFYAARCNVILFQLLNFMAMLSIVVCAVIKLDCWFGSFMVVILMHNYAKMVIILSCASHNWDEEEGGVSVKTILSSMITISRYHLGTIMLNLYQQWYVPLKNYWVWNKLIDHEGRHIPSISLFILKYSEMITAIYGQNSWKAAKSVWRLVNNGQQLTDDFKTKQSTMWSDMFNTSGFIFLFVTYATAKTKEDLIIGVTIFTCYLLVNGIYLYVFVNPVNTIENTIQFCKTVKQEDLEIIDSWEIPKTHIEIELNSFVPDSNWL